MLAAGQAMFLLVPSTDDQRVLQPGKVIESSPESFTIEFEKQLALPPGLETLAFCDVRGKFFQQGATLVEIRTDTPVTAYLFQRAGEPVSAEQRQTFRVSVVMNDIVAQIGAQKKCRVADVSAEGFGAIGSPGLAIGSMQKVSLRYDSFTITADARVQTSVLLPIGAVRYGLLVPRSNIAARNTLQKLSASFQRTQLRRLAGAA